MFSRARLKNKISLLKTDSLLNLARSLIETLNFDRSSARLKNKTFPLKTDSLLNSARSLVETLGPGTKSLSGPLPKNT